MIFVLSLLLSSCSKIPKSAYNCFDIQTNKRKFTVIYHKNLSSIFSPTDWAYDGLSNYNEDFWEPYREKPIHVDKGFVIEYFEDLNLNSPKKLNDPNSCLIGFFQLFNISAFSCRF